MIASLPVASVHVIVPPLAVLMFLAFLVMLVVVAKIAGSATRGPAEGSRGCLGGCGLVAILALLALLSIAGFVAFVATLAGVSAIEHNPIKRIDILVPGASEVPSTEHGEYPAPRDGEVTVVLHVESAGDLSGAVRRVRALLERRFDVDERDLRNVRTHHGPDGSSIDVLVPMRRRDLEELRRELESWGIELGEGVRITLEEERGI